MSTEVGSLQANLALDLSDFRAGMDSAAQLASELAAALKSAFDMDLGLESMKRQVAELNENIKALQGSVESFQALAQTMSGADLFAAMRTHTAALPAEVANIQTAMMGLTTSIMSATQAASLLTNQFTLARGAAQQIHFPTNTGAPDFTATLTQLQEMSLLVTEVVNSLQGLRNSQTGTPTQIYIDPNLITQINQVSLAVADLDNNLITATGLIQAAANETTRWAEEMQRVAQYSSAVISNLTGAAPAARTIVQAMRQTGNAGKNAGRQVDRIKKGLQTTKGYAISIKGIIGGIVISQAFYRLLNVMQELVHGSIEFSKNMQDAGVAFEYLMRNSEVSAQAFLNALKDIALQSPLDTTNLTSAARQLMAMGFSAQATVPALQILTDTAAVFSNSAGEMSDQISHIALAFGQMLASGKVSAQELRQLYNAGLPIYELLADGLGITMKMAKNIGHYNVDSATAVYAVLQQLQQRYGGAAQTMSHTFSGAMEVIKESLQTILSYGWDKIFQRLTGTVDNLAQRLKALVKITQAYGAGGAFQAIIPEHMWTPVRETLSALLYLLQSVIRLFATLGSIAKNAFGGILGPIAYVAALLGSAINVLSAFIGHIYRTIPAVRALVKAIMLLVVANVATKAVMLLAKSLYVLTGAKVAVGAIGSVISGIQGLISWSRPGAIAVMGLAAALLAVVLASAKVRAALGSLFGSIKGSFFNALENINLGFEPGNFAMPEFQKPDTADFSAGLSDLISDMEDTGDAAEDAGKKIKKNLQSFDEVYQIEDDADDSGTDQMAKLAELLDGIGGMNFDNLFDWTGDWATDWGNLTAGIGDFADTAEDLFGNLAHIGEEFWTKIAEAFDNPEFALPLLAGIVGAIIGSLFGHPILGALVGAALGKFVAQFWEDIANFLEKAGLGGVDTLANVIAAILGAALGLAIAVKLKTNPAFLTGLGALAGWTAAELTDGIKNGDWSGFSTSLGTTLGYAIGKLVSHPLIGAGIGLVVGYVIDKFVEGFANNDSGAIATGIGTLLQGALTAAATLLGKAAASLGVDSIAEIFTNGLGSYVGDVLEGGWAANIASSLKTGLIGALANIGVDFITKWLNNLINEGVSASAEDAARGNTFSGWAGTILSLIGAVVGTIIAPGIGTIIGGALGNLLGDLLGNLTGVFWPEISAWFVQAYHDVSDWITQAFTDIGNWLTTAWESVGIFFTETIPGFFVSVADTLAGAAEAAWEGVKTFFTVTLPEWFVSFGEAIKTFFTVTIPQFLYNAGYLVGYAIGTIVKAFVTFFTETIPTAWNDFVSWGAEVLTAIGEWFVGLLTSIGEWFVQAYDDVVEFFTVTIPQAWEDFRAWLESLPEKLDTIWSTITEAVATFFTSIIDSLVEFFTVTIPAKWNEFVTWLKGITEKLQGVWDDITTSITTWFDSVVSEFTAFFTETLPAAWDSFWQTLYDLGENIINGIWEGLKSGWDTVTGWVGKMASGFVDGFKDAFGIHSPADTMVGPGGYIVLGVEEGISKEMQNMMNFLTQTMTQPMQDYLTQSFDSENYLKYGQSMILGIQQGILNQTMIWIPSWMDVNVKQRLHSWMAQVFAESNWVQYGRMVDAGIIRGIDAMAPSVMARARALAEAVAMTIASALSIASPSKVTTRFGEYIDRGLIVGMTNEEKDVLQTASNLAQSLADSLNDVATPDLALQYSTSSLLGEVKTWSAQFVSIMQSTFDQLGAMFEGLGERLRMMDLSGIDSSINARIGTISAADNLASPATAPTGTVTVQEVIASLKQETINLLSDTIAMRIYEYLMPLLAQMSPEDQDRVLMYVGTLVADDNGLKALERRLYEIRQREGTRR